MKQKLFAILFCMSAICVAQAQVKISNTSPLDVSFRRCIVKGDNAYIDLTLANYTSEDYYIHCSAAWVQIPAAYDDEGNIYNRQIKDGCFKYSIGGDKSYDVQTALPVDVTIKLRVHIEGIDEYATKFTKVTIPIKVKSNSPLYWITLSNVPFTRQ